MRPTRFRILTSPSCNIFIFSIGLDPEPLKPKLGRELEALRLLRYAATVKCMLEFEGVRFWRNGDKGRNVLVVIFLLVFCLGRSTSGAELLF